MKRPSFQYYPGDKQGNINLRRCTWAERGVWWYLLDFFHDSEEYGILRWSLEEIARALGCEISALKSLAKNGVLKGSDDPKEKVSFSTSIAKKNAPAEIVILIDNQEGPLWYSSRMVRDEHIRKSRAVHGIKAQNNKNVPRKKEIEKDIDKDTLSPSNSPSPSSSSSSSSVKALVFNNSVENLNNSNIKNIVVAREKKTRGEQAERKKKMPDDFCVTEQHRELAQKNNWPNPDDEIEAFKDFHQSRGNRFIDWDKAFYTWLRNAKKFNKTNGGNYVKRDTDGKKTTADLHYELCTSEHSVFKS